MREIQINSDIKIIEGDALEVMKTMPENSVDSIVTDPPYGIGFMGKEWDNFTPSKIDEAMEKDKRIHTQIASQRRSNTAGTYDLSKRGMLGYQNWYCKIMKECLRVLKPGGHLLSFGGTRTYHRMACAIEDVGFEVRDMVEWIYGSGFPKSLNIGKTVDKLQGNKRIKIGRNPNSRENCDKSNTLYESGTVGKTDILTKGTSEWEGWGTALKPSHEPICLARKPLSEKSVAENVLKWRTGGLNIDESRIPTEDGKPHYGQLYRKANQIYGGGKGTNTGACLPANPQGRFPANLILSPDPEVLECFPNSKSTLDRSEINRGTSKSWYTGDHVDRVQRGDSGSASRFFKSIIYTAKASKSERNMGCEGLYLLKDNTPKEDIEEIKHLLSI